MKTFLKYSLNIQLFAEPGDDGNPNPNPSPASATPEIDYDMLAEAISKRSASHETTVLKGILKEQGLTQAEVNEAVKLFKENKENKAKEEQKRIDDILAENKRYKEAELMKTVNDEASKVAKELNVRDDRVDTLIALCDRSKFTDDKGVISKDNMKKEIEEQLKKVPEFTSKKNITIQSVKGNDTPQNLTEEEAYRQRKYGKNKYFKG